MVESFSAVDVEGDDHVGSRAALQHVIRAFLEWLWTTVHRYARYVNKGGR